MMTPALTQEFSSHVDGRGTLLSIDLASIPFAPQRVFTVAAPGHPSTRGGHETQCSELIALIKGVVRVRLGVEGSTEGGVVERVLSTPGQTFFVPEGQYLEYDLETGDSVIVVFASGPFRTGEEKASKG